MFWWRLFDFVECVWLVGGDWVFYLMVFWEFYIILFYEMSMWCLGIVGRIYGEGRDWDFVEFEWFGFYKKGREKYNVCYG